QRKYQYPDSFAAWQSRRPAGDWRILMSARLSPARGFTILDLTVVIVIVMLLISLLLPAVQAARESARRLQCQHNLTQIGIALMNYQHVHGVLPPGSVSTTQPVTWLQPPDGLGSI
ncbi:MAG: type II secretion system protein, partial [Planctomycetaceae bacterium]